MAPVALTLLIQTLKNTNVPSEARIGAARGLAYTRAPAGINALIEVISNPTEIATVRGAAAEALGRAYRE